MASCPRCHGLLLRERLAWQDEVIVQRACLNCGGRVDPVILANRENPPDVNDPVLPEGAVDV
jgi:hypothetical protein